MISFKYSENTTAQNQDFIFLNNVKNSDKNSRKNLI